MDTITEQDRLQLENIEAAADHYQRRTLLLEQEIDELRLRNNHLRRLLHEYRRAAS